MSGYKCESKKEALAKIAELTDKAYEMVKEAERIADANEVGFSFDVAYGMGGYYDGEEGEWNPSSRC